MVIAARFVAFLAFAVATAWLAYAPGFDSAVASAAGLAAFLASLFLRRRGGQSSQVQKVSGNSSAVQAGRDVHINK